MARSENDAARRGNQTRYHKGGFYDKLKCKIAEIAYDGVKRFFLCYDRDTGEVESSEEIVLDNATLVPYHEDPDNLIESGTVLVPSYVSEFGSLDQLAEEFICLINKYVEAEEDFVRTLAAYGIFSYRHEDVSSLGYIGLLGDFESGKSRCLDTVGRLCYLPAILANVPSDASIFRVHDRYPGTLVFDEGDKSVTDSRSGFVQIMNSGYKKSGNIVRCSGNGSFVPEGFNAYGPKMFATRSTYQDAALESRLIHGIMKAKTRQDIPLQLPDSFYVEQEVLRSKLYMYRMKTLGTPLPNVETIAGVGARRNQIYLSMAQIVDSSFLRDSVAQYMVKAHQAEMEGRAVCSTNGDVLCIIADFLRINAAMVKCTVKEIAVKYREEHPQEKMTNKDLASLLRSMGMTVRKGTGNKTYYEHDAAIFRSACEKYGIEPELP